MARAPAKFTMEAGCDPIRSKPMRHDRRPPVPISNCLKIDSCWNHLYNSDVESSHTLLPRVGHCAAASTEEGKQVIFTFGGYATSTRTAENSVHTIELSNCEYSAPNKLKLGGSKPSPRARAASVIVGGKFISRSIS